jgi:hypothetical protein
VVVNEMFYFVIDISHQNNEKIYVVIGPNIIIDQVMHGATIYRKNNLCNLSQFSIF